MPTTIILNNKASVTLTTLKEAISVLYLFDPNESVVVNGNKMKVGQAFGYCQHNTDLWQPPQHKKENREIKEWVDREQQKIEQYVERRKKLLMACIAICMA